MSPLHEDGRFHGAIRVGEDHAEREAPLRLLHGMAAIGGRALRQITLNEIARAAGAVRGRERPLWLKTSVPNSTPT